MFRRPRAVHDQGARHRDLHRDTGPASRVAELLNGHHRAPGPEPAGDGDRRVPVPVLRGIRGVEVHRRAGHVGHPFHVPEQVIEEGEATQFPVVDDVQPDPFLHRDGLVDRAVLDPLEFLVADPPGGQRVARLGQVTRTQQRADHVGVVRHRDPPVGAREPSVLDYTRPERGASAAATTIRVRYLVESTTPYMPLVASVSWADRPHVPSPWSVSAMGRRAARHPGTAVSPATAMSVPSSAVISHQTGGWLALAPWFAAVNRP